MKALLLIAVLLVASPARAQEINDGWILHLALGGYMTLNGVDLSNRRYIHSAP